MPRLSSTLIEYRSLSADQDDAQRHLSGGMGGAQGSSRLRRG